MIYGNKFLPSDTEIIEEGVNEEYTRIFGDCFTKYCANRKEANKAAKNKDYNTAIKKYNEAKENAKSIEAGFKKVKEDNFSSAVIGMAISNLIGALSLPMILIVPYQHGQGAAEEFLLFVRHLKSKNVSNYKAFNGYRNKLILAARKLAKICTMNIDACKAAQDKEKKK